MRPDQAAGRKQLSIVIKALNEERNIERTLRSAVAAVQELDGEVILADSLSTDRTVRIAEGFPVAVAQLTNPADRCCGVGAQLGYQYARGEFVLVMDGDMEVDRDWLQAALAALRGDPGLAGVGGLVEDVNLDNIEFRARQQRKPADMQAGEVDRLDMGGLYRREAIEAVGYLTHQGLHACEELELGLRLRAAGWRMMRLPLTSILHYGHTDPTWVLVRKRWRSRYVNGAGELLRSSIGQPWFAMTLRALAKRLIVVGWWAVLLALGLASLLGQPLGWVWLACLLAPPLLMSIRKRSLGMGFYSVLSWCVDAAGLLRGSVQATKDPRRPVASRLLQSGSGG
ncbi:MAG TPA: glycosyltransferase [Roseateles sp.]|nr:glycosyltransferase [Roseateles sp.]